MKTIYYPPQHITEVGDIIYNSPPPERIVIDPKYLATEIKERLDDNGHYHIELGDDKVTIDIELDCEWQYFDHPYAKDGVSIYNIEVIAWTEDGEIDVNLDLQELVDSVYDC